MIRFSRVVAPTMLLAAGSAADAVTPVNYTPAAGADPYELKFNDTTYYTYSYSPSSYYTYYNKDMPAFTNPLIGDFRSANGTGAGISGSYSSAGYWDNDQDVFISEGTPNAQIKANRGMDQFYHLKFADAGTDYTGYAKFSGGAEFVEYDIIPAPQDVGGGGSTPAVPEPATWAEMILGLGGVGMAMRAARRRRQATVNA